MVNSHKCSPSLWCWWQPLTSTHPNFDADGNHSQALTLTLMLMATTHKRSPSHWCWCKSLTKAHPHFDTDGNHSQMLTLTLTLMATTHECSTSLWRWWQPLTNAHPHFDGCAPSEPLLPWLRHLEGQSSWDTSLCPLLHHCHVMTNDLSRKHTCTQL